MLILHIVKGISMNKYLGVLLLVSLSLAACSKKDKAETAAASAAETAQAASESTGQTAKANVQFDPNQLAQLAIDQSKFPYFSLPEGYVIRDESNTEFQKYYLGVHNQVQAFEGQVYSVGITTQGAKSFAPDLMVQAFNQNMQALGAEKLNDQEIDFKLYEAHSDYGERSAVNIGQKTYTYGFKNQQGHPVLIQYTQNSPAIVVMQLKPLEIKMTEVKSSVATANEMAKSIADSGKAVVHINFAVDQAKIESSSLPVIEQITAMLKQNSSLKLSIEGHTDQSGHTAHNKKLSEQRAEAVRAALVAKGIEASRLSSKGFGAEKPVADNQTETGKAENRRVELVKVG